MNQQAQQQLNATMHAYVEIKRQIRELQHEHDYIKQHLLNKLDGLGVDGLESVQYTLQRTYVQRESLPRNAVPAQIWEQYKSISEFPVLHIKPL
jgi:hypothetical protein